MRAYPPIGTARCLLAVMTAAGQNRLFCASGICRLAGPVPAGYSLHCLQFPLRFSSRHGRPLRAAGRRDAWSRRVCSHAKRGLLEKQLPQRVGGQGFPPTGGPPWRVVSPVDASVEQRTDSKPGRLGVIQAGA